MEPHSDLPQGTASPAPDAPDASDASFEQPTGDAPTEAVRMSSTDQAPVVPAEPVAPVLTERPVEPIDTILARASASPSEATLEPLEGEGASPAVTQPVGPRQSRRRWAIAGGVVVAVVALSIAAAFTLSSAGQASLTAGVVPKSSLFFATLRTDLPGDQQQKVADLLSHFPGFADQSLLEQSLGETLDKLVRATTNGKHDYQTEIKPWLGGEIGMAITRGPAPGETAGGGALIVVQAKDAAKADAWIRGVVAAEASTTAGPDQTYDGVTIHTYSQPNRSSQSPEQAAEAVTGQLVLFGDLQSVKAALDARTQGGLDTTDAYRTASKSIAGDHLATVYVNVKSFMGTALEAAAKASPSVASAIPASLADNVPAWSWMTVRAESTSLVVDAAMPRPKAAPSITDRVSTLAPKLPGNTVAVIEVRDLGTMLKSALDQAASNPSTKAGADQLRQGLLMLGGVDHLLGWIGDTAVVVTANGTAVDGGLVVNATDEKAAADTMSQIRSLLVIGLSSSGASVGDETYNGTTITTVDLTDLAAASMGQGSSLPAGTKIKLAFATRGDLVVFGVGDAFVKAVLDVTSGSSLADSASYKAAIDSAGSSNAGQAYVDVGSIMQTLEPMLAAQSGSRYTADYKPYVQHLQAVAISGKSGDPAVARFVITVK